MAAPQQMGIKRLQKEYQQLCRSPAPHIAAAPLPSNIFTWHYVLYGLQDCPYAGGYYHGQLVFPHEYPLKPPAILMLTPNGRFQPRTRLCLSISDFHPASWNPTWSVETILKGLLSFMLEDASTVGSIITSVEEKHFWARESLAFNLRDEKFQELFPELCQEMTRELASPKRSGPRTHGVLPNSRPTLKDESRSPLESMMGQMLFFVILALFSFFVYSFVSTDA
eukprot:m.86845 g.86845  ORF g.86845 m.86845 type:complete len:224 (-) comp50951_c0_seq3:101-772(-)